MGHGRQNDTARPPAHAAIREARRATVEPLLVAGLSVRAIAAQTGISASAVFRIKQEIEQAKQRAPQAAPSPEPPSSYVTQRVIDRVPTDVRRLTITVYERGVTDRIKRNLLPRDALDDPWAVTSALFAGMFSDLALRWLQARGYLDWSDPR